MEIAKESDEKRIQFLESELANLRTSKEKVDEENKSLRLEVQKGVEDVTRALGYGYNRCLGRLSASGVDISGHSFEDYIRDYATSVHNGVRAQNETEKS